MGCLQVRWKGNGANVLKVDGSDEGGCKFFWKGEEDDLHGVEVMLKMS